MASKPQLLVTLDAIDTSVAVVIQLSKPIEGFDPGSE
jgi:hypothetical protein